jgi:hypothetical protein
MNNPNVKLLVEITNLADNMARFILRKGAQLDTSIISPRQLIELHNGKIEQSTLEDKAQTSILKSVMGECTQDITGKCTFKEAVMLIRALNHTQNAVMAEYK